MKSESNERRKRSYRGLKLCCGVTAIVIVITAIVLVVVYFTILKPKEPKIITQSVTLEKIRANWPTLFLNFTLGIGVTIDNKNYAGFKYSNNTASISYRGNVIGDASVPADTIPARKKQDVHASVTVFADDLFKDANFLHDFLVVGILNFSSATTLQGKVSLLNVFKEKATVFNTCDISLFIVAEQTQSVCHSKVSF